MSRASLPAIGLAMLTIGLPATAIATETITYTYDAQGRLVTVVSTGSVNNNQQTVYTHDNADNRQRVLVTGSP